MGAFVMNSALSYYVHGVSAATVVMSTVILFNV